MADDDSDVDLDGWVAYRIAYGAVRDRLRREFHLTHGQEPTVATIRYEVRRGSVLIAPSVSDEELTLDGPHGEKVREAIEDALAGRRPQW
jgi:hypothetical protein